MDDYETLVNYASDNGYAVIESYQLDSDLKGAVCNRTIVISNKLENRKEQRCILAEEIAHGIYNTGDITDQRKTENRRQEKKARKQAVKLLVPWEDLFQAVINLKEEATIYSLSESLDVTPEFLLETIEVYSRKYGPIKSCGEYLVFFDPFHIIEKSKYLNQ